MKILLIDSGIMSSTGDTFRGYLGALQRAGHQVVVYQLSSRIDQANYMLQRSWVKKGKPADNRPTGADIYARASEGVPSFALRFMPDLVLVITSQFLHPDTLVFLERAGFNVGLIFTESPYCDVFQAHYAKAVDVAWTNERTSVERLRERSGNDNIFYLSCAYDPTIHTPEPQLADQKVPSHDVVFVGSGFPERAQLLGDVDWTGIDLGLYGDWRFLPSRSPLRAFLRGFIIPNTVAASLYRNAKIGLNLYRDGVVLAGKPGERLTTEGAEKVPAESLNPRAYELAAVQCFQVSQYREEVVDMFGDTVPTFRNATDLEGIIRYALSRPDVMKQQARWALNAVQGHTFDARVTQLLEHIATVPTIVPQRVGLADRSRLHAV